MPLNDIAKAKLIDWINKIGQSIHEGTIDNVADRGRSIVSLGEIFSEDEEWAKELVSSGYLLTFINFLLRKWEDLNENIQDTITKRTSIFTEECIKAIESNDWLKFHKTVRDLVYDITQIV